MADPRVKAAVLLCLPGIGGTDLTPLAAEYFPFMSPDFAELETPSLIVAGDHDQSPLSVRGPDWFTDGYRLSPGATDLLALFGAEHGLGGSRAARVAMLAGMTREDLGRAVPPAGSRWTGYRIPCWRIRAEPPG